MSEVFVLFGVKIWKNSICLCREQIFRQSTELVCRAYREVYSALTSPTNSYKDPENLVPRSPQQVQTLLSWVSLGKSLMNQDTCWLALVIERVLYSGINIYVYILIYIGFIGMGQRGGVKAGKSGMWESRFPSGRMLCLYVWSFYFHCWRQPACYFLCESH